MIAYQLTGKTRYRIETRCFKKPLVVVQVEVHRKGSEPTDSNGNWSWDFDDYVWRDAQMEDFKFIKGEA
jgi:hypothetical protein